MKVSIIIPAHNATDTIQECLTRVFAAVAEREDCEIIVVDDGSDDDTAEIAAGFPVKLIRLECCEGRIRAREMGAEAASADRLLFVDTRVLIPADTLRVLEGLEYEPVVVRTTPQDPATSTAVNRALELIRKRVYAPYYPPEPGFSRIMLSAENFNEVPKGMGAVFVDRTRFLSALPQDRSRFVNDDTRLFRAMIDEKEIMIPEEICIVYRPRDRLWDACRHLFHRGPRFADFHLRPGGRFYPLWVSLCFSMLVAVVAVISGVVLGEGVPTPSGRGTAGLPGVAGPSLSVAIAFVVTTFGFLLLLALSVYLAETFADFLKVLFALPLITGCFGLGVLRGKLRQIGRAPGKVRNRWLLTLVILVTMIFAFGIWGRGTVSLAQVRWRQLVPLGFIHLGVLVVNGLVLRRFLKVYGVCLSATDWFGLAVVTSMGSYLATGAGGMMARAALLKHRFNLEYSKFAALLSANYLLNVLVASIIGLLAYGAHNARTGFDTWGIPVLLILAGIVALALALTRPLPKNRSRPVAGFFMRLHEGWEILSRHPTDLLQVAGLLAINMVLQAAALRVAYSIFSFELEPDAALLLAALSSFAIFFSVTPANLGVQEGFTATASYVVGAGFAEGIAAMAALRAVAVVNVFVLGPIFSYLLLRKE